MHSAHRHSTTCLAGHGACATSASASTLIGVSRSTGVCHQCFHFSSAYRNRRGCATGTPNSHSRIVVNIVVEESLPMEPRLHIAVDEVCQQCCCLSFTYPRRAGCTSGTNTPRSRITVDEGVPAAPPPPIPILPSTRRSSSTTTSCSHIAVASTPCSRIAVDEGIPAAPPPSFHEGVPAAPPALIRILPSMRVCQRCHLFFLVYNSWRGCDSGVATFCLHIAMDEGVLAVLPPFICVSWLMRCVSTTTTFHP